MGNTMGVSQSRHERLRDHSDAYFEKVMTRNSLAESKSKSKPRRWCFGKKQNKQHEIEDGSVNRGHTSQKHHRCCQRGDIDDGGNYDGDTDTDTDAVAMSDHTSVITDDCHSHGHHGCHHPASHGSCNLIDDRQPSSRLLDLFSPGQAIADEHHPYDRNRLFRTSSDDDRSRGCHEASTGTHSPLSNQSTLTSVSSVTCDGPRQQNTPSTTHHRNKLKVEVEWDVPQKEIKLCLPSTRFRRRDASSPQPKVDGHIPPSSSSSLPVIASSSDARSQAPSKSNLHLSTKSCPPRPQESQGVRFDPSISPLSSDFTAGHNATWSSAASMAFCAEISGESNASAVAMSKAAASPLLIAVGNDDGLLTITEIIDQPSAHHQRNSCQNEPKTDAAKHFGRSASVHLKSKIRYIDFSSDAKMILVATEDDCTAVILAIEYSNECTQEDGGDQATNDRGGVDEATDGAGHNGDDGQACTGTSLSHADAAADNDVAVTVPPSPHSTPRTRERSNTSETQHGYLTSVQILRKVERSDRICCAQFRPDGQMIGVGGYDGKFATIAIQDLLADQPTATRPPMQELSNLDGLVLSFDWHRENELVCIGTSKGCCTVTDHTSCIVHETNCASSIQCVRWNGDGSALAIASRTVTIMQVNVAAASYQIQHEISISGCNDPEDGAHHGASNQRINALCWSGDGAFLAVGKSDGTCAVLETVNYAAVFNASMGHGGIASLAWGGLTTTMRDTPLRQYLAICDCTKKIAIVQIGAETGTTANAGGAVGGDVDSDGLDYLDGIVRRKINKDHNPPQASPTASLPPPTSTSDASTSSGSGWILKVDSFPHVDDGDHSNSIAMDRVEADWQQRHRGGLEQTAAPRADGGTNFFD